MKVYKKHIIIECSVCGIEMILVNNNENRTAAILNNMSCPFTKCNNGKLIVKDATDSFKECINDKNTYKREKGRIKQQK